MAFDNSGTKAVACDHPQKGVNYHLSSPEFDKPYVVRKLSISEAQICSFSRIGQKMKKIKDLLNFCRKTEKFHLTELYDAPLKGSTIFLSQLHGWYVVGKLSIS